MDGPLGRMRRICQWSALALVLVLPMVSRGGALYRSFGPGASHVDDLATPWESFLYHAFSTLFSGLADPVAAADMFQGSIWSITLFGVTISDPLALIGHSLATGSVHWPLAAGAVTPVLLAVVAGRAFCGWVCPVNTVLEWNAMLRRWLEKRLLGGRLPAWTPPLGLRYHLLAAGLLVSATMGVGAFALMLPYTALARDWHLAVYGTGFGFGVFFMAVLLAVELLVAPRLWCRSLCPTGLVLGLLGRRRLVGIATKPARQCLSGCRACVVACPIGVTPMASGVTPKASGVAPMDGGNAEECLMCNACVRSCPADVLTIGFSTRRPAPRGTALRLGAVAALVLAGSLVAGPAAAHHMAGLPHYGYLENYPQTPTRESRVLAPPYEITLVSYMLEGLDAELSETPYDAMIYVAIAELDTGEPYTGSLELSFRPLDGGAATTRSFGSPLEETVYRARLALPADAYDVSFRIDSDPVTVAALRLELGGGVNWWFMTSAAVAAVALAMLSLVLARRLRRRRLMVDELHRRAGYSE